MKGLTIAGFIIAIVALIGVIGNALAIDNIVDLMRELEARIIEIEQWADEIADFTNDLREAMGELEARIIEIADFTNDLREAILEILPFIGG